MTLLEERSTRERAAPSTQHPGLLGPRPKDRPRPVGFRFGLASRPPRESPRGQPVGCDFTAGNAAASATLLPPDPSDGTSGADGAGHAARCVGDGGPQVPRSRAGRAAGKGLAPTPRRLHSGTGRRSRVAGFPNRAPRSRAPRRRAPDAARAPRPAPPARDPRVGAEVAALGSWRPRGPSREAAGLGSPRRGRRRPPARVSDHCVHSKYLQLCRLKCFLKAMKHLKHKLALCMPEGLRNLLRVRT